MGVAKILATQEYTHAYHMWKSIADDEHTSMHFKLYFREAYIYRYELEQTAVSMGYGSANNVNHGEIEDAFVNFELATASRYAAFTKLTTTNRNLSKKLCHQEDQICALQVELCNLKVDSETQTTNVKGNK